MRLLQPDKNRWHIFRVEPLQERRAKIYFKRTGVRVCTPKRFANCKVSRYAKRTKRRAFSFFPGHIFVQVPTDRTVDSLLNDLFIQGVLRHGDNHMTVETADLVKLQRALCAEYKAPKKTNRHGFKVGQRLEFLTTTWHGLFMEATEVKGARIVGDVTLFGNTVTVTAHASQLRAA